MKFWLKQRTDSSTEMQPLPGVGIAHNDPQVMCSLMGVKSGAKTSEFNQSSPENGLLTGSAKTLVSEGLIFSSSQTAVNHGVVKRGIYCSRRVIGPFPHLEHRVVKPDSGWVNHGLLTSSAGGPIPPSPRLYY